MKKTLDKLEKNDQGPKTKAERAAYVKPAVVYEGELETMAAVCDSAFAGFGNCRTAGIPTCVRLTV